tara:strand:+ start:672 stop:1559 length:888 start_codon:yes stop_codon:yes gene_type:complete
MADAKISSLTNHGTPVAADYVASVLASGPSSRKLLLSDVRNFTSLKTSAASVTTADVTGVVNELAYLDLSGLTAARNFTLPAVAAADDRVGVYVSAGCTTAGRELILKANTGDTLNGVSAAEWSRLFITGECVIMRCVVANTTWVVDYDGRIETVTIISGATGTDQTAVTRNSYQKMTTVLSTVTVDTSSAWSTGTKTFTARRTANMDVFASNVVATMQAASELLIRVYKNGSQAASGASAYWAVAGYMGNNGSGLIDVVSGSTLEAYCYYADTGTDRDFYGSPSATKFILVEKL